MASLTALPLFFQSRIGSWFIIRFLWSNHPPHPHVKMRVLSVSQWFLSLSAFVKQNPITGKSFIQDVQRKIGWKWPWKWWSFFATLMQLVPWFCSFPFNKLSYKAALVLKMLLLKPTMGWGIQIMIGICQKEVESCQRHHKTVEMAKNCKITHFYALFWLFQDTFWLMLFLLLVE